MNCLFTFCISIKFTLKLLSGKFTKIVSVIAPNFKNFI